MPAASGTSSRRQANIRLSIESISCLEHFADDVGHPADLHQDGYLFLLDTPESVETFRRNVELQRSFGIEVDWLDAKGAAALAPGLDTGGVSRRHSAAGTASPIRTA